MRDDLLAQHSNLFNPNDEEIRFLQGIGSSLTSPLATLRSPFSGVQASLATPTVRTSIPTEDTGQHGSQASETVIKHGAAHGATQPEFPAVGGEFQRVPAGAQPQAAPVSARPEDVQRTIEFSNNHDDDGSRSVDEEKRSKAQSEQGSPNSLRDALIESLKSIVINPLKSKRIPSEDFKILSKVV